MKVAFVFLSYPCETKGIIPKTKHEDKENEKLEGKCGIGTISGFISNMRRFRVVLVRPMKDNMII